MEQQSNSIRPEQSRAAPNKLPYSPISTFFAEKLPVAKRELIGKLTNRLRELMVAKMFQQKQEISNPQYHVESLDDIRNVGTEKPLGVLTLELITGRFHEDPAKLAQEALGKGLLVKYTEDTPIHPPALYVANRTVLANLLQKHAKILQSAGWPTEPEQFIENVSCIDVSRKTKLYNVIADAYADYINPGRTDVERYSH